MKLKVSNESKSDIYIAEKIDISKEHSIVKDENNRPKFLFRIENVSNEKQIEISSQDNFRFQYNVECEIKRDNITTEELYTILECLSDNQEIQKMFLDVSNLIISKIGVTTSNNEIIEYIKLLKKLVEIRKNKSFRDVQGLWAELFVIAEYDNSENILKAWQSTGTERWDFYDSSTAIEVKSTQKTPIIHHFTHEQLYSKNDNIYVISLKLLRSENGLSCNDLISKIKQIVNDDQLKFKLDTISTLMKIPNQLDEIRFDLKYAKENISIYNANDIPRVESIKKGIKNLKYSVDMSHAKISSIQVKELF